MDRLEKENDATLAGYPGRNPAVEVTMHGISV
jgi:hypothetical protein